MNRAKTLQAALAAAVGLGLAAGAQARDRHHEDKDIGPALAAKITAAAAIATAEQQMDGLALKVEFETEKGKPTYEVRVFGNEKLSLVHIDPDTGKVTATKNETGRMDRDDRVELSEMASASGSLGAAMRSAEARTGGRAVEARTRDIDGIVFYRVEVAKGEAVHKVTVDSAGRAVKVSTADEDEDRDGDHGERRHHEDHDED